MADETEFSLGHDQTAEAVYGQLSGRRQQVIDMARLMAELTIPSHFPPEGYQTGDNLPGNNQSKGAECVNSLASKLMFMAFPPGQPIVRIEAIEYEIQAEVDKDPELWSKTQLALARLELSHRKRLATTTLATAYTGYLKALIIGGNALWKHIKLDSPAYYLPTEYVVKRDKAGQPLLTIHKECVTLQSLDEDLRGHVLEILSAEEVEELHKKPEWEQIVDIYSVCKLKVGEDDKSWLYWQEFRGQELDGTSVETDFEVPPMHPGWLIPVYGDDWGRGQCEEYRGDLYTVEAQSSGLNDGVSVAALALGFVKPGSTTSIKQIREARNLSVIPGDAADLTWSRSDKGADLNFVGSNLERVERRLSAAFLSQSAIQRSGERVTKEEIIRVGTELDKALGGLYTQIAQGNQRVVVMRAMRLNEEENPKLPQLPKGLVEVQVVTGVDALGDTTDAENLTDWATAYKTAYPETFEAQTNGSEFGLRLAVAKGVKPDGLMKTKDQMEAEQVAAQRQQMMQSVVDKGAGPAVTGLANAMGQQAQDPAATPTLQ